MGKLDELREVVIEVAEKMNKDPSEALKYVEALRKIPFAALKVPQNLVIAAEALLYLGDLASNPAAYYKIDPTVRGVIRKFSKILGVKLVVHAPPHEMAKIFGEGEEIVNRIIELEKTLELEPRTPRALAAALSYLARRTLCIDTNMAKVAEIYGVVPTTISIVLGRIAARNREAIKKIERIVQTCPEEQNVSYPTL